MFNSTSTLLLFLSLYIYIVMYTTLNMYRNQYLYMIYCKEAWKLYIYTSFVRVYCCCLMQMKKSFKSFSLDLSLNYLHDFFSIINLLQEKPNFCNTLLSVIYS